MNLLKLAVLDVVAVLKVVSKTLPRQGSMVDMPRPFEFLIKPGSLDLFFLCEIVEVLQVVQVCLDSRKPLFRSSQGAVQSLDFPRPSAMPVSLRFVCANVLV